MNIPPKTHWIAAAGWLLIILAYAMASDLDYQDAVLAEQAQWCPGAPARPDAFHQLSCIRQVAEVQP